MIVTEEEAKARWCPETLIGGGASDDTSRANRWVQQNADGGPVVAGASCIGSACMAWRWYILGDHTATLVDRTRGDDRSLGYCGKAGKP